MSAKRSNGSVFLSFFLHFAFFISGIATVIIGQLLPIISKRFDLNDLQLGYLFPSQFAGSIIGTFLTNWLGKKDKFLLASIVGCLLMAGGIFLLNVNYFPICLLGFFINGIGIGLTLPSINMMILEAYPERAASALNILNFFWGLGAISSQPFVNFTSGGESLFLTTALLGGLLFISGIAIILSPNKPEQNKGAGDEGIDYSFPIWSNPIAWLIVFFNFIHVGFESGIGGWLTTYTSRIDSQPIASIFSPTVLYFLFFVIGRGIAPVFTRFLNENRMIALSLLVIISGMVIILFAKDLWLLSFGASIAGLGTSSVFPTNMARFTKAFGPSASRRATPFFIGGTLGAAATTWGIGFVSERSGNLNSGMYVLLGSCIILIFLQIILMLRGRAEARA